MIDTLDELLQKTIFDNLPQLNINLPGISPFEAFNNIFIQIEKIKFIKPLEKILILKRDFGEFNNITLPGFPNNDFKHFKIA